MTVSFIIATDLQPHEPDWDRATLQARAVAAALTRICGFEPAVRVASIPGFPGEASPSHSLAEILARQTDASEIFVLPAALDFNLWQREAIGQALGEQRRALPDIALHHDDVDMGDPLLAQCFADQALRVLTGAPQQAGVIVAASGHGDPAARAQSYRFMRLLWEQSGFAQGEVGFVRHERPFLRSAMETCASKPLEWILVPQSQWKREHVEYAETILADYLRDHPEGPRFRMAEPPGDHPAITAWLTQRAVRLWREKRTREAIRVASPKHAPVAAIAWQAGSARAASVPDSESLRRLLEPILPQRAPDCVLVKVTWHGYATGTYTDPAALDMLLSALPSKAVILEGHTASRNLGEAPFDWETEARQNRAWIRREEAEYLRRTGLADVLRRHGAQYVNVTEAFWDEACAAPDAIAADLHHPELAGFVPEALLPYRGCPMISFAKFKGPTRLGISNLFGLIPAPLRSAWHGPNITYFAQVCCDLAKLYGGLFDLCGLNEALFSAVRWNRQGLYRSRWGNYDLVRDAGIVTVSRSLAAGDILASRLQGQDVSRSAFFDVVKAELGWDADAEAEAIPQVARTLFT